MKIGVLTQPLHNNYGGLLQAYALKAILTEIGHEVLIINRIPKDRSPIRELTSRMLHYVKKHILPMIGKQPPREVYKMTFEEKVTISMHTRYFIEKYIESLTKPITSNRQLKNIASQGFDASIVGSDQVWRRHYSPNLPNYFLDFVKKNKNIKRIAYAASFGLDKWHYPYFLTKKCKLLASKFDAVSVREDTAVELCRKHLDINATHLVDPTMLLDSIDYLRLVDKENPSPISGSLLVYILDETIEIECFVKHCSLELNLHPFRVNPSKITKAESISETQKYVYPPVTQWIKGFEDAKFVITDSFHGCVFSILFNVPFIAIGNPLRGLTRIISLLRMFDLMDRLTFSITNLNINDFNKPINWERINKKLVIEKEKGIHFLETYLS